jgi:hypothetical protein
MQDLFDAIGENQPKYFSVLDLRQGYLQQALDPESVDICAFAFGSRTLAFTRSPQGLNGSPMKFSQLMYKVLGPFYAKGVCNYLDDTVLFTKTYDEHLHLLDNVLSRFKEANLKLYAKKCIFAAQQVEFLGMQINSDGIVPSERHVDAVKTYPRPTNVKELRVFLGLVNFFNSFIKEKAKKVSCLTRLTKKNVSWDWDAICEQNFIQLKHDLSTKPVLVYPDYSKRFYVFTDSSQTISMGGSLMQIDEETGKFQVVAHCGRSLRPYEKSLPIPELEALACVYCLTKWEIYLQGAEFTLYTDHQALTSVLGNSKKLSPKLSRWALYLSQFKYEIKYKPGLLNASADSMSRRTYDVDHTETDEKIEQFPYHPDQVSINTKLETIQIGEGPEINSSEDVTTLMLSDESINELRRSKRLMEKDSVLNSERTDIIPDSEDSGKYDTAEEESIDQDSDTDEDEIDVGLSPGVKLRPSTRLARRDKMDLDNAQLQSDALWQNSIIKSFTHEEVRQAQRMDNDCNELIKFIEEGALPRKAKKARQCILREMQYNVVNGCLHILWQPIPSHSPEYYLRLIVPKSLRQMVLDSAHKGHGAHTGMAKTMSLLIPYFMWPGMYTDVVNYISKCTACLLAKKSHKTEEEVQGLYELCERHMQTIHVDLMGPLDKSRNGNRYICAAVCRYSGYLVAWPTRNQSAANIARQLYTKLVCVHGIPDRIVSDNGGCFISDIWKEMSKLMNIKLTTTAPYSPQSNSRIERANLSMANCLRAVVSKHPTDWDIHLPTIVAALNATTHYATGLSPNTLIFGRHVRTPEQMLLSQGKIDLVPKHEIIEEMLSHMNDAHVHAMRVKEEQIWKRKLDHDAKITPTRICPGSVVFWKKPPRPDETQSRKLMDVYKGPYIVIKKVGSCVQLKDLDSSQVWPKMVAIRQLKAPVNYNIHPTRLEKYEIEGKEELDKLQGIESVSLKSEGIESFSLNPVIYCDDLLI